MKSQDIIYSLSLNFNASENDFNGTFLSYLEFVRSVVQFFRRTVQANLRQLFQFINYYLKIKVLNLSISIWRKIAILFSQQVLFAKTDFLSTESNLKFRLFLLSNNCSKKSGFLSIVAHYLRRLKIALRLQPIADAHFPKWLR